MELSINFELTPLTSSETPLWKQLPTVLKNRGFGFYMSQHDDDYTMTDDELYWSYAANYYYFNKEHSSFTDWQKQVKAKVISYQEGVTPEQAAAILEQVKTEKITFAEGAKQLFSRRQLFYYGW